MFEGIKSDYAKTTKRTDYIFTYRITASECLITGTVIKGTHLQYFPHISYFFDQNFHACATSYNANIN